MVCRDIGGQNTGLERPRTTLATQLGQKVGSFQTSSGFSRAQFFVAHSATSMLFNTLVHPAGEPNDEGRGDLCLSCTCHPARQILTAKDQVHSSHKSQRRWHARASAARFPPA